MVGDHDHVTAGDQKLDCRLRSRRAGGDRAHLHIVGEDRALEAKVRPEQGHRGRRQVSGTLRIQCGKEEMAEQHEISSVSDGGLERRQVAGLDGGEALVNAWQLGLRSDGRVPVAWKVLGRGEHVGGMDSIDYRSDAGRHGARVGAVAAAPHDRRGSRTDIRDGSEVEVESQPAQGLRHPRRLRVADWHRGARD